MKLHSSYSFSLFNVFIPLSSNSLVCRDERDEYMRFMAIVSMANMLCNPSNVLIGMSSRL